MHTFSTQTTIKAPVTEVWETLADIGSIYQWNPGVIESHTTSKPETGPGASRHCDLGGNNYLDEEVAEWQPEKKITMRITDTNLPFKSADIRFTLQANDIGTVVTVSPLYELKFGLLGRLLNQIYVENNYKSGMEKLLAGLKNFIEGEK
jgi:uncharacterized protein YndB with AHSA1/START domain